MRFLVILAIGFTASVLGAHASSNHPCQIRIRTVSSKGVKQTFRFTTPLRTRAECAALAKMHQPNFDPTEFTEKSVKYKFSQAR